MILITTIDGVFNNTNSLLKNIKILPEKIELLNNFCLKNKPELYILNADNKINRTKFDIYSEALKLTGLSYKFKLFYNSSEATRFLGKTNKSFIIITSEPIFRNEKNVLFTNRALGIQKSDLIKLEKQL